MKKRVFGGLDCHRDYILTVGDLSATEFTISSSKGGEQMVSPNTITVREKNGDGKTFNVAVSFNNGPEYSPLQITLH
jgi:hypothetical protein